MFKIHAPLRDDEQPVDILQIIIHVKAFRDQWTTNISSWPIFGLFKCNFLSFSVWSLSVRISFYFDRDGTFILTVLRIPAPDVNIKA